MEFYLLEENPIPTGGSGRILVTDVSSFVGTLTTSDNEALICRSSEDVTELRTHRGTGDWYLDPEIENTILMDPSLRIDGKNDRGWTRNRGSTDDNSHRVVRLKRVSETALEGQFTCHIPNDSNNNKSLLILYPSEW